MLFAWISAVASKATISSPNSSLYSRSALGPVLILTFVFSSRRGRGVLVLRTDISVCCCWSRDTVLLVWLLTGQDIKYLHFKCPAQSSLLLWTLPSGPTLLRCSPATDKVRWSAKSHLALTFIWGKAGICLYHPPENLHAAASLTAVDRDTKFFMVWTSLCILWDVNAMLC